MASEKRKRTHLICHSGRYRGPPNAPMNLTILFIERGDLEETACATRAYAMSDASVAHQRESLTGAGVEADRRDSLLFHFISFFPLFFYVFCSNSPDG